MINFAPFVLKVLMFKVCGIMGISKIEYFNFYSTERVFKKLKKENKNHSKSLNLVSPSLFEQYQKIWNIFWFFTEISTLWLPVLRWAAVENTDLRLEHNTSKTVKIEIVLTQFF